MNRPYLLVVMLLVFWVVLTESLSLAEVTLGLVTAIVIALGVSRLVGEEEVRPLLVTPRQAARFLLYVPYLVKEIVAANIQVAETVLDPRLPIDPIIIECHYPLAHDVSVVGLANSITLTPGTLTVDVDRDTDTFRIHCLGREVAEAMPEGELYHHIRHVFEED